MIVISDYGRKRCELLADYLIRNNTTVRATALYFGISKSTVHKDLTERLCKTNPPLFLNVKAVLDKNKAERHLRGGEATKRKYLSLKEPEKKPEKNSETEPKNRQKKK